MINIPITQENINEAIEEGGISFGCPIARGMSKFFDTNCWVGLHKCGKVVSPIEWELPSDARRFVRDFDEKRSVKPFVLVLNDCEEKIQS